MLVYEGLKKDFLNSVEMDTIAEEIESTILEKMGRHTPHSEFESWMISMEYMYKVLNDNTIPENAGVAIEYNIPQTAKRVDFMISGYDEKNKPGMVIIELKQWQKLEKVDNTALVNTFTGHANRNVVHPSYQAWSYAQLISDYNTSVQKDDIVLSPCSYLHNYVRKDNDPLDDDQYNEFTSEAPAFTIAVMLPIALCVFGPAGAFIGKYVVGGLFSLEGVAGFIGIGLIAALYPVLVMTGMHMVLITALFQVFATKGFDGFAAVAVSVSSFSIMGVGIGAFFRLKNKEQKALALSYGITAIVAGTSEPTIYGICTKYKKPFIGLLAGGFIGGAYAGLTGVIDATLVPSSNVFAALCFLGKSQAKVVNGIIACVIAFVSTALLVYFFGFDKNEKDIQA